MTAAVDADVSRTTYDGYLPSGVYTLAPSIGYASASGMSVRAAGAFSRFDTGHGSAFADVTATVLQLPVGQHGGTFAVTADASDAWYRSEEPAIAGLAGPRLQIPVAPDVGFWTGAAGGSSRITTVIRGAGRFDGGVWGRVGPLVSSGAIVATVVGATEYTDYLAVARIDAPWQGATVAMTAGARSGALRHGVSRWLSGELQVPILPPASLIAAGGSVPTDILRGYPGAHYLSLGLRLVATTGRRQPAPVRRFAPAADSVSATAAPVFLVLDAGGGRRTLRFEEPAGSHVSLLGDFTGWQPIPCRESEPGVFEVTVPVESGAHRVDLRIDDGPLVAPPGLARVADDFGGEAGLLLVP